MRLLSKIRRDTFDVPVWLVCNSRGTVSIVNAATHLKTDRSDGLFLTASVLTVSDRVLDVFQFGFTQIREPVLKVHHHNDDFWVTPASKTEPFKQKLINAKTVDVFLYEGGRIPDDSCEARLYQGFPRLEARVAVDIAEWIGRHGERHAGGRRFAA